MAHHPTLIDPLLALSTYSNKEKITLQNVVAHVSRDSADALPGAALPGADAGCGDAGSGDASPQCDGLHPSGDRRHAQEHAQSDGGSGKCLEILRLQS